LLCNRENTRKTTGSNSKENIRETAIKINFFFIFQASHRFRLFLHEGMNSEFVELSGL